MITVSWWLLLLECLQVHLKLGSFYQKPILMLHFQKENGSLNACVGLCPSSCLLREVQRQHSHLCRDCGSLKPGASKGSSSKPQIWVFYIPEGNGEEWAWCHAFHLSDYYIHNKFPEILPRLLEVWDSVTPFIPLEKQQVALVFGEITQEYILFIVIFSCHHARDIFVYIVIFVERVYYFLQIEEWKYLCSPISEGI